MVKKYLGKIDIGNMSKKEFLDDFMFNSNFFLNKKFKDLPDQAKDVLLRHHGYATKNDLIIRIDSIKYKKQQYKKQTDSVYNRIFESSPYKAQEYLDSRNEGLNKLNIKLNNAEILNDHAYKNPFMLDNNANFLKEMRKINQERKLAGKEPLSLDGKKDLNSYLMAASPTEREYAAKYKKKSTDSLISQAANDYESFRVRYMTRLGILGKWTSSVCGGVVAYTSRIWKKMVSFNYGTTRGWINYLETKKFKRFDKFKNYVDRIAVSSGDAKILDEIYKKSKKLSSVTDISRRVELEDEIAN